MKKTRYAMILDTETTGLPQRGPYNQIFMSPKETAYYNEARIIQLAFLILNLDSGEICREYSVIIKPTGSWTMHPKAFEAHHISVDRIDQQGIDMSKAVKEISNELMRCCVIVCHNTAFDLSVLCSEMYRQHELGYLICQLKRVPTFCTMKHMTREMNLPHKTGNKRGKWPRLVELYSYLFGGETFDGAHDAMNDVRATTRCFCEIIRRNVAGKTI